MFEEYFACTFDLLNSIPSLDTKNRSVTDDIVQFNHDVRGSSRCRLVRNGRKADMSRFGIDRADMANLLYLVLRSERSLAGRTIESCFTERFFQTPFWIMWSTTFAFQSWHSAIELRRYIRRFIHLLPGFKRLEGILRTRLNQYDSIIAPMIDWLTGAGVQFQFDAQVIDAMFEGEHKAQRLTELHILRNGSEELLEISPQDRVYLTLGSMTGGSTTGSNTSPAPGHTEEPPSLKLWRRLAAREPGFGQPDVFMSDDAHTRWESFTVTLQNPSFFRYMENFTGNAAGTGGLVTIADSSWMMSIVLFHQPHFRGQPDDVFVFWGYGLRGNRRGDVVRKPLADCTGDEILQELAGQLHLGADAAHMFDRATVKPCLMPYITSQFMPRRNGDRPQVVPKGAENFAVLGQFCEMPDDTVFTVEYSVRSAMTAVHVLTGKGKPPPRVKRTDRNPAVLWRALRELIKG